MHMGFGSYDESEQKDQSVDTDEDKGVSVHENDHDGEVSFDSEADSENSSTSSNRSKTSNRRPHTTFTRRFSKRPVLTRCQPRSDASVSSLPVSTRNTPV